MLHMHWRTFKRLEAEHDAFADVTLAGIAKRLRLKMAQFALSSDARRVSRASPHKLWSFRNHSLPAAIERQAA